MQINRDTADSPDNQGLFAVITGTGEVRNINILDAEIEANDNVGALAGRNEGTVINARALVSIDANDNVGGLIGDNTGTVIGSNTVASIFAGSRVGGLAGSSAADIINSYASGVILTSGDVVGGLVGSATASINNSYADTEVTANSEVGGLVGILTGDSNDGVTDSYASGVVRAVAETNPYAGGLIGRLQGLSRINSPNVINSYASAEVSPDTRSGFVGGLIGNNVSGNAVITSSFWDIQATGQSGSAGGFGYPNPASSNPTETLKSAGPHLRVDEQSFPYFGWDERNWYFGDNTEYPRLRYGNIQILGLTTCGTGSLPDCGSPITPPLRNSLKDLRLAFGSRLVPPFVENMDRHRNGYFGSVSVNPIRLIPTTTQQEDAVINIYADTDETMPGLELVQSELDSGGTSEEIELREGINRIVLEIVDETETTATVSYPVYIRFLEDLDNDGFVDIDNLEELRAITDAGNTTRTYELVRSLDFNDPDSYVSGQVNRDWIVVDFRNPSDDGWLPGEFGGELNGNGLTIANLQINRGSSDNIGLFSQLSASAMIRNLGLLNVDIVGNNDVGGLIGSNTGRVVGCFVTGEIIGSNGVGGLIGSNNNTSGLGGVINSYAEAIVSAEVDEDGISDVGGLVGRNVGHNIYNSYAGGRVRGTGSNVGGLVGISRGDIINSYTTADVDGQSSVGGLVGQVNTTRTVTFQNNYATGEISGSGGLGGLIGAAPASIYVIRYNYFNGEVSGTGANVGSLVGITTTSIVNSYANADRNRGIPLQGNSDGRLVNSFARPSVQLQQGVAQTTNTRGVYYQWNSDERDDWDFGSASQYPILNYAPTSNPEVLRICGDGSDDLPQCGTPISPQIRDSLQNLTLADGARLDPPFGDQHRELNGSYFGNLTMHDANTLRIIPSTTLNAPVSIYVGDVTGKPVPDQQINSGETSAPITLERGITRIVLEFVVAGQTIQYPVYLNFNTKDRNGDGIAEIDDLDELFEIRDDLAGSYELVRNLDFNDPDSYAPGRYLPGEINRSWTVLNFEDPDDRGWLPIGIASDGTASNPFTGNFDGNGFTISNLKINDSDDGAAANNGLFASIGQNGEVSNLGLLNVQIEGRGDSGGLAGSNRGKIRNVYVVGEVSGGYQSNVGGLVGENIGGQIRDEIVGQIVNSYVNGTITAYRNEAHSLGGLVGTALGGAIVNSYASGVVDHRGLNTGGLLGSTTGTAAVTIVNSYAEARVSGANHIGWLGRQPPSGRRFHKQ